MKTNPPRIGAEWPEQQNFIYAGIVRGAPNQPDYHLLVHPDQKTGVNWIDAMHWAENLDASLPLRRNSKSTRNLALPKSSAVSAIASGPEPNAI